MSTEEPPKPKINYRVVFFDLVKLTIVLLAVIFAVLFFRSHRAHKQTQKNFYEYNTHVKQRVDKFVAESQHVVLGLKQKLKQSQSQIDRLITEKNQEIAKLGSRVTSEQEKTATVDTKWRSPLKSALNISQDIYSMKWDANNQTISELENTAPRSANIVTKWQQLIASLEDFPEFQPELNKLKVRIAQTQAFSTELAFDIDIASIDWEAAGLEEQKPYLLTEIYAALAQRYAKDNPEAAIRYATLARAEAEHIDPNRPKGSYTKALVLILNGKFLAHSAPDKAIESYVAATDLLSPLVTAMPEHLKLKSTFTQACLDGAFIAKGDGNAAQAERLRKKALVYIGEVKETDKTKEKPKPKLLAAELKIYKAEKQVREGTNSAALKTLEAARADIKAAGGSVVLSAAADSCTAFIRWDHGERTKAFKIMDSAINSLKSLIKDKPNHSDAHFQLASLYWVRSSMQLESAKALTDAKLSTDQLITLISIGAGKHEPEARRMIAIIYTDIGEQAYNTKQRSVAKQYFEQARKQWIFLGKHFGENDEYTYGAKWCKSRIDDM